MKLELEDYKDYKKQVEKSLRISLMAIESDRAILEKLNKKINSLDKDKQC